MIQLLEEISMNSWPALQTHLYDGWILRSANGYSKRSNSVNPIFSSDINLDKKIKYCENFYNHLKLPTVFKITSNLKLKSLDKKLESLKYSKIDCSSLQIMEINSNLNNYPVSKNIDISYNFSTEWFHEYISSTNLESKSAIFSLKKILENITNNTVWVKYKVNNKYVAFGLGVIERGYVGIYSIFVNKKYRGKGYSKLIMNAIISEAKKLNADIAYLQVVENNKVAVKLYSKLGFKEVYKYWYRIL